MSSRLVQVLIAVDVQIEEEKAEQVYVVVVAAAAPQYKL